MPDQPTASDTLMAEVNALAQDAVAEIASDADAPGGSFGSPRPAASGTAAAVAAPPRSTKISTRESNIERVLRIEVPVIVRLAERSMPLSEILNLTSGAIIEFDKSAESELDLLINNKCIGHGLAVKVGENFGLRVTRIGSVQDRIRAMGK